jgi:hypothetical protein
VKARPSLVSQRAEAFPPLTLGHIRSHGCRDLLVYCRACALYSTLHGLLLQGPQLP